MIICARGEKLSNAREIGVGLVGASIELSNIILRENPREIIFAGSAGSYDMSVNMLEIFTSCSATQIEASFVNGDSYTPIPNKIEYVSRETPSAFGDTKHAIVNSSNYITTNATIARNLCDAGILLENMEFFAILSVGQHYGIPTIGVFCVTNYCNSNAHSDFLANHSKAQERLESHIRGHYG